MTRCESTFPSLSSIQNSMDSTAVHPLHCRKLIETTTSQSLSSIISVLQENDVDVLPSSIEGTSVEQCGESDATSDRHEYDSDDLRESDSTLPDNDETDKWAQATKLLDGDFKKLTTAADRMYVVCHIFCCSLSLFVLLPSGVSNPQRQLKQLLGLQHSLYILLQRKIISAYFPNLYTKQSLTSFPILSSERELKITEAAVLLEANFFLKKKQRVEALVRDSWLRLSEGEPNDKARRFLSEIEGVLAIHGRKPFT